MFVSIDFQNVSASWLLLFIALNNNNNNNNNNLFPSRLTTFMHDAV